FDVPRIGRCRTDGGRLPAMPNLALDLDQRASFDIANRKKPAVSATGHLIGSCRACSPAPPENQHRRARVGRRAHEARRPDTGSYRARRGDWKRSEPGRNALDGRLARFSGRSLASHGKTTSISVAYISAIGTTRLWPTNATGRVVGVPRP